MRNYKDFLIYFTRCVHINSINILSVHEHGLMGKTEEHEGKNILLSMIIFHINYQRRLTTDWVGRFYPPLWICLNNSETVEVVNPALCSIN